MGHWVLFRFAFAANVEVMTLLCDEDGLAHLKNLLLFIRRSSCCKTEYFLGYCDPFIP